MSTDLNELLEEYKYMLSIVETCGDEALNASFPEYIMSCALKIWGSHDFFSPVYADCLKAITGKDYSVAQIVTAMHCCAEPGRTLNIPDCLTDLVTNDRINDETNASEFVDCLSRFLVSLAFVNGDFTIEEANSVDGILSPLMTYCKNNEIDLSNCTYVVREHITPLHREGYWNKEKDSKTYDDIRITETDKATGTKTSIHYNSDEKTGEGEKTVNRDNHVESVKNEDKSSKNGDDDNTIQLHFDLSDLLNSSKEEPEEEAEDFVNPKTSVTQQEGPADSETLESLLEELNELVGLANVKRDVISLINFIKISRLREERGMKMPTVSYHLVFTGNPGTGKTTIARLVAKIYYQLGLLSKGQLVETDRSSLVAGYLGQTAIKTQKVIESALGGVLFIDEAYSLANDEQDSYGKEAIETILKAMEDHRNELIVIVAGYTDLMHKFIDSNPGLRSRFNKYFEFSDYSGDELLAIFNVFCKKNGYELNEDAHKMLLEKFNDLFDKRDKHFGNARLARNVFEKAINAQANRIASLSEVSDSDLISLSVSDITEAMEGVQ